MEYEGYQDIFMNTKLIRSDMVDVDTSISEMYQGMQNLNCDLPCTVARSIKILSVSNDIDPPVFSYIICSFSDGRALSIGFDHQIASSMENFTQDLDHITRNEAEARENPKKTSLSDYQILSIGTIELDLRYLNLD